MNPEPSYQDLRRLAHPFWFQSFGAVMGMDWHSSGITTSVIGALKRGLGPLERELGTFVISSLQASLWKALQILKYRVPVEGYGRLLRDLG